MSLGAVKIRQPDGTWAGGRKPGTAYRLETAAVVSPNLYATQTFGWGQYFTAAAVWDDSLFFEENSSSSYYNNFLRRLDIPRNQIVASVFLGGYSGSYLLPVGQYIYMMHGTYSTSGSGTTVRNFRRLDPKTNTLTWLADRPALGNGVAFAYGDKIYWVMDTAIYAYTISTNTWSSSLLTPPRARGQSSVLQFGPDVYLCGGANSNDTSVDLYSIANNTITAQSAMPTMVGRPTRSGAVVGDKGYVYYASNANVFDRATGTWSNVIGVGITPQAIAANPHGSAIYAVSALFSWRTAGLTAVAPAAGYIASASTGLTSTVDAGATVNVDSDDAIFYSVDD